MCRFDTKRYPGEISHAAAVRIDWTGWRLLREGPGKRNRRSWMYSAPGGSEEYQGLREDTFSAPSRSSWSVALSFQESTSSGTVRPVSCVGSLAHKELSHPRRTTRRRFVGAAAYRILPVPPPRHETSIQFFSFVVNHEYGAKCCFFELLMWRMSSVSAGDDLFNTNSICCSENRAYIIGRAEIVQNNGYRVFGKFFIFLK